MQKRSISATEKRRRIRQKKLQILTSPMILYYDSLVLRGYIRIASEPFHRVDSAVASKGLVVHVGRRSEL